MTRMWGKRLNSWKTIWARIRICRICSRWARLRPWSGSACTFRPSTSTDPTVGSSRKFVQRRRVDLPLPDRPMRQIVSLGYTSRLQPRRTWLAPKYFSMPWSRTMGAAPGGTSLPGIANGSVDRAVDLGAHSRRSLSAIRFSRRSWKKLKTIVMTQ